MAKTRRMLSDWRAPYIQSLMRLIETQSKATLTTWAIDYAERFILPLWEKHVLADKRPAQALTAARRWLAGEIKLPEAKPFIIACHEAARAMEGIPIAQAAACAIAQCASTIHSAQHCIGLAFYGALAIAYDQLGTGAPWAEIESFAAAECGKMEAALRAIAIPNEPHPAKINWNC